MITQTNRNSDIEILKRKILCVEVEASFLTVAKILSGNHVVISISNNAKQVTGWKGGNIKATMRNSAFHKIVLGGELLTRRKKAKGKKKFDKMLGEKLSVGPNKKGALATAANITAPLEERIDFANTYMKTK